MMSHRALSSERLRLMTISCPRSAVRRWIVAVIAAERRLVIPGETSNVDVTTGAGEVDTIGTRLIPVVPTVLLTQGADGQPTRRLTERYASSLGTATLGVFEVADSTVAGGWRVAQRFKVLAVNP